MRQTNNKKKPKRKGIKRTLISIWRKFRRFLLRLVSLALTLIIPVGLVLGVLHYSGINDNILPEIDLGAHTEDREIPETDTSGFTYYETPEENIVTDEGITYAGNEILVTLNSEQYKGDLDNYLTSIGASIVGGIEELAEYQILLDRNYGYTEIKELANTFETFDWVNYASPNYMMKLDTSYTPNDSKWKYKWGNLPEGNNWDMEAIDAPGAWDSKDELSYVNIGVIDGMFVKNHEDLKFAEQPLYNEKVLADKKGAWDDDDNHGTHVAGTIAATCDNDKGIAGVSIHSNLYGASMRGLEKAGYYSVQAWNIATSYLIVEKRCSVVNISMGYDQIAFEASRKIVKAEEVLKEISESIEKFLKLLIERNYSFVICKSAGNQNKLKKDSKYWYFRKDDDDTTEIAGSYAYYSYNDYLNYCHGKTKGKEYFKRYKNRKKEIKKRLEGGNVDAKYDFLGAIEDSEVKNRIIMVGSAQNLGTTRDGFAGIFGSKIHKGYKLADSSQCGERVDVVAPGVQIYSTVKNGYDEMSGTSMACPHVAGIAGLIFSAKPDIDADKVKQIIVDSAEGSYGEEGYGLVNARKAVEMTLGYTAKASQYKKSTADRAQNSESEADAYELYQNAAKQLTNAGSWSEKIDGIIEMNVVSFDNKQKARMKIYLDSSGDVSGYDENDLSALKVSASANIQAGGQETAFTVNYENGIAHYQYTKPTSYSADADIDSVYFKFSKLTSDMMQNTSVTGNFISFTIAGDRMTELGTELISMISGIENLQYGDCDVTIILDEESSKIEGINMKYHASLTYQGYNADADYDVNYHFAN